MESGATQTLRKILETIGISFTDITSSVIAGQTVITIQTRDDERILIGTHSDTIHALDHLVKKIVETSPENGQSEDRERPMFLIDVNDHRARQIKDLQAKALMMAERARSFQYDVELSPMNAYERLIIHTTLQDAPNVKTESQGEGHNRRVVIKYAA